MWLLGQVGLGLGWGYGLYMGINGGLRIWWRHGLVGRVRSGGWLVFVDKWRHGLLGLVRSGGFRVYN